MSFLFKFCMYITSFLPLWLSIIFIEIMGVISEKDNLITEKVMLIFIPSIVILSIIIMIVFMRKKTKEDGEPYEIISARVPFDRIARKVIGIVNWIDVQVVIDTAQNEVKINY